MSIPNYSVVKGDPSGPGQISGANPHYRFELKTGNGTVQVDVNVRSTDGSDIRYLIINEFAPADAPGLDMLLLGRTALAGTDSDLRLDYVRQKNADGTPMVDPSKLQDLNLADSRLHDAVADLLNQALADPDGLIYAFGSYFADANTEGVHNIHMNRATPRVRLPKTTVPGRTAPSSLSYRARLHVGLRCSLHSRQRHSVAIPKIRTQRQIGGSPHFDYTK